ncbi:PRC-barrel domain-containing protein [uncultured Paludibaculum sp.]|uniref:PRC-barrel domain-containing protein n=1 Tax=uncultured Paludibaculum sp. TaxID=1765020 RepID=UPI002AAB058D|nr:PRC-barrel domain-containing protein [uncultured Paludibaculum sp.]
MLRSLNTLFGSVIQAVDGELGHVHDFLFDERGWTVRYIVVETGSWFSSRQVLVSPAAASQPDWERRVVPVSLTQEQVRNSPDVDTEQPVSRQQEIAVSEYYGWPAYWSIEPPLAPVLVTERPVVVEVDTHLRSAREVMTYSVDATDREMGHIDDLIMDDANWFIRYLVAGTGSWFRGQKLLLATRWVSSIVWAESRVVLAQSHDQL